MKLILVLSVIAYGYADKLDRTYLPPPNAASAGGNAGLMTPFGSQPSGPAYNQASSGFGSFNGANQPQGSFGQNGAVGKQFDVSNADQGLVVPNTFEQRPERPQAEADKNAEILKYENENNGENFAYSFETSNGISAEESGVATNGVQAQGGFSYTGDDGQTYSIKYTADENGYLPEGDHLPTPHPIPEEILKSIEENARAAAAGTQEGAYRPEEYENESQSPQQYNANSFNQGQAQSQGNAPSQQYGTPNNGFSPSSAPQNFNQPQRPANQFNQGAAQGPAQGPSQFGAAGANNARGSQNGYDYNRPQASFAAANQGSSQYRPQTQTMQSRASQSGSQNSIFPRPSGQAFNKPSTQYGGPSGPSQSARPQGPFNAPSQNQFGSAKSAPAPAFPKSGNQGFNSQPQGPAPAQTQNQFAAPAPSFSRPSAQPTQASPNAQGFSAAPKSQKPIQAPYQYNRPAQQGPFGQPGTQQGTSQPAQGSFRQAGQQGSFRQSAQQNSFGQSPQERPSSPAQTNFGAKSVNQGSSFGAPRQPPSFSEQEGYKY